MLDNAPDQLIARYLAGECSPEEVAQLDAWIAADPVRAEYVESLREAWRLAGERRSPWRAPAAWAAVRARIEQRARDAELAPPQLQVARAASPAPRVPSSAPRVALPAGRPWLRVAAAIALLAGSAGVWWRATHTAPPAAAPAPLREVATRPGERAEIYLSDGTHVVLGMKSRLRFAAPLSPASRDVYLEGEALFDVKHDARWPFRVHATHGVAEDLGTKFNVDAYADDSVVTVVVAEGEVALAPAATSGRTPAAVLRPGQLGRLARSGDVTVRSGVDVARYLAWTEGRMVFANTPLRDILPQLGRWHDLEFRLADPALGARRLTATFTNESAAEVLRSIAFTLDLRYEQHGRTVTFLSQSPSR